jgi:cell division septum initiation protein DivIVA
MRKFSYEANGYNKSEVMDFVDYVIDETKNMISIIKTQESKIDDLTNELNKVKEDNTVREMAEDEAKRIVYDAKEYASIILNDTLQRANKLEEKNLLLENTLNEYKDKLRFMIEEQETVLDKIEDK